MCSRFRVPRCKQNASKFSLNEKASDFFRNKTFLFAQEMQDAQVFLECWMQISAIGTPGDEVLQNVKNLGEDLKMREQVLEFCNTEHLQFRKFFKTFSEGKLSFTMYSGRIKVLSSERRRKSLIKRLVSYLRL